jgi:formylglycine-generating enzyme required for sulfatase activity
VEFCDRLKAHTGLDYRLPSEAEWEYACRAGTETPFYFGETLSTEVANYNGDLTYGSGKKGRYVGTTTAIETYPANAWGLYDMHGNVREWCADLYHENYKGAPTNGSIWNAPNDSGSKILRGGSWRIHPALCRSADRGDLRFINYDFDYGSVGFRVACSSLASKTL